MEMIHGSDLGPKFQTELMDKVSTDKLEPKIDTTHLSLKVTESHLDAPSSHLSLTACSKDTRAAS